jgi:hypothetical protein
LGERASSRLAPLVSTVEKSLRERWSSWRALARRRRNQTESQLTFVPIKMRVVRRGRCGKRKAFSKQRSVRRDSRLLKLRFRKVTEGANWRIFDI